MYPASIALLSLDCHVTAFPRPSSSLLNVIRMHCLQERERHIFAPSMKVRVIHSHAESWRGMIAMWVTHLSIRCDGLVDDGLPQLLPNSTGKTSGF